MAKILTDREMGVIVFDAVHNPKLIECADAYRHFLEDLGELICSHFGGGRGNVGAPGGDVQCWTCGFHINECVPGDGGVFRNYDTGVVWENGKETEL